MSSDFYQQLHPAVRSVREPDNSVPHLHTLRKTSLVYVKKVCFLQLNVHVCDFNF